MPRERLSRILDMIENARLAVALIGGRARGESRQRHHACSGAREGRGDWRAIAGTRDKLIHGYFSVDHDVLWAIASGDLEIIDVLDKRV
jgi:uncharacterized protein with HEPN domain